MSTPPNTESAQESTTSPAFVSTSVDTLDGDTPQVDTSQNQTEDDAENPFQPKKMKKTSKVWVDFKEVATPNSSTKKAECIHCKTKLTINKTGATSHFLRHLANCSAIKLQKSKGQQNLTITKTLSMKETVSSVQNFQYDHSKLREIISHMIIVHELPFCFSEYELFNLAIQTATPHYQKISRAMAKKDCISSYEMEKKKLMVQLKSVNCMSLTTDLWKSDQNLSYMVITGHYVDSNWQLTMLVTFKLLMMLKT